MTQNKLNDKQVVTLISMNKHQQIKLREHLTTSIFLFWIELFRIISNEWNKDPKKINEKIPLGSIKFFIKRNLYDSVKD